MGNEKTGSGPPGAVATTPGVVDAQPVTDPWLCGDTNIVSPVNRKTLLVRVQVAVTVLPAWSPAVTQRPSTGRPRLVNCDNVVTSPARHRKPPLTVAEIVSGKYVGNANELITPLSFGM